MFEQRSVFGLPLIIFFVGKGSDIGNGVSCIEFTELSLFAYYLLSVINKRFVGSYLLKLFILFSNSLK